MKQRSPTKKTFKEDYFGGNILPYAAAAQKPERPFDLNNTAYINENSSSESSESKSLGLFEPAS